MSRLSRLHAVVPGLAALLVVALAGSVTAWFLHRTAPVVPTAPPVPAAGSVVDGPRLVSEADLRQLASAEGPVYWAGPEAAHEYELTRTTMGAFFVRYLPDGVAAGSSDSFLTVATYPQEAGSTSLQSSAQTRHLQSWSTRSGALVVVDPSAPLSAYFSFPDAAWQVEVYSATSGEALDLVLDGSLEFVGPPG